MGDWVTLLRVATTIAQCGMILSPCPDIIKAHRNKTTGEVAALPLVSMVVQDRQHFPAPGHASDRPNGVNCLHASGVAFSMLFTVVMMLFSTSLWAALSIVDDDKIIMSLNITGVFLSATQISVYIYYRPNKSIVASEDASVPMDKRISLVILTSNTTQAVKSPIYQSIASPSKRPVFEDRINDK
ncbi:Sugar efflux transporter for intercellular exchange [Phytophthora infestans]|uniref:Sugar efflux transporter for intercellular exchange n=1 Tax=Phytophthora infestans TaxID=4787 RepID=A0A833VTJ9_PHYIN|nr:Sugar efflux transporter for intercellular exchange [Phytophthora infestans]